MLSLTRGELAIVLFLFVLTWGAGLLPRLGEWMGERSARRAAASRRRG
jgi:hypothetical protein